MNYLQGYKLRRTLLAVKSEQRTLPTGESGLPMRPTFHEDLVHKLDVMFLHHQAWGEVAAVLGCSQACLTHLRNGRTTAGRKLLAKLDTEYRIVWHQINLNLRAGRRVDEGSPRLEKWRAKRKDQNVGYHGTRRAKRESGRSSRPAQAGAAGKPTGSATTTASQAL